MKKASIWCALFLFFLLVLTGCSQSQNMNSEEGTDQPGRILPTVGEPVSAGNLVYTILSVKKEKSLPTLFGEELKPTAGSFLVLDVRVENRGKREIDLDPSMFRLVDKNGKKYEADPRSDDFIIDNGEQTPGLFFKQLNPQGVHTGKVVFDVPDRPENEFIFVGKGGILAGKEINIQLAP